MEPKTNWLSFGWSSHTNSPLDLTGATQLVFNARGEASRQLTQNDLWFTIIVAFATCVIFLAGLFTIKSLWTLVFETFSESSKPRARVLRDLVGGLSVGGKVKLVGVGLLGTLVILWFCTQAISYLDFRFTK